MARKPSAIDAVVEKAASEIEAIEDKEAAAGQSSAPLAKRLKQMLADMRARSDMATSADLAALEAEIDRK